MNLLCSVPVEGDGHPLQGLVATLRAEYFLYQRRGVEAGIAPQYPGLRLLQNESILTQTVFRIRIDINTTPDPAF